MPSSKNWLISAGSASDVADAEDQAALDRMTVVGHDPVGGDVRAVGQVVLQVDGDHLAVRAGLADVDPVTVGREHPQPSQIRRHGLVELETDALRWGVEAGAVARGRRLQDGVGRRRGGAEQEERRDQGRGCEQSPHRARTGWVARASSSRWASSHSRATPATSSRWTASPAPAVAPDMMSTRAPRLRTPASNEPEREHPPGPGGLPGGDEEPDGQGRGPASQLAGRVHGFTARAGRATTEGR